MQLHVGLHSTVVVDIHEARQKSCTLTCLEFIQICNMLKIYIYLSSKSSIPNPHFPLRPTR